MKATLVIWRLLFCRARAHSGLIRDMRTLVGKRFHNTFDLTSLIACALLGLKRWMRCSWHKEKQGLRQTWKLRQCTNWKVNLWICELAKAWNKKNWSVQLDRLAGLSSWSFQLVCILLIASYTFHLTQCILHIASYILHLTHCMLHIACYTLHLTHCI